MATFKNRFGCFSTSLWAFKNSIFPPVVHRDSWPVDGQKSICLEPFYIGSDFLETYLSDQTLVEQGKFQFLLKNPGHFSDLFSFLHS
jgi:hypothetical protein